MLSLLLSKGQAQVVQHFFAIWGEVGTAMMLTRSDKISPIIGIGGGGGFGYEMQYSSFIIQTGVHINSSREWLNIQDGDYVLRNSIDSEGYMFDFWYHQAKRKDDYRTTSCQIPLLLGGEFKHLYFLVGAKANIHLYTNARSSGIYSSLGDYEPMIDVFEDMPNHQFFTDYTAVSEEKYKFNFDVLISGEIGIKIGNYDRANRERSKFRIAIYADYGLLDCHVIGDNEMISFTQSFNAADMQTSIHPHHFLSTKYSSNAVHNLQVGIKLSYLINLKNDKKWYCPNCNEVYTPRRRSRKCTTCIPN